MRLVNIGFGSLVAAERLMCLPTACFIVSSANSSVLGSFTVTSR